MSRLVEVTRNVLRQIAKNRLSTIKYHSPSLQKVTLATMRVVHDHGPGPQMSSRFCVLTPQVD